jgi:nucleotide-binding universal stress UspA family protein
MIHLDRVLFPTDGSACAERAWAHARSLANRFDAALDVLQVVPPEAPAEPAAADAASAPSPAQPRCVPSRSPADGILRSAARHDATLIVLGTHGRRGVERLLMGSVAEEVVRRASGPVFTVGRQTPTPATLAGGRLLVPVDFSPHRARLLGYAREWARLYDLSCTLLHVVETEGLPDAYSVYQDPTEPDLITNRVARALAPAADALRAHGLDVEVAVRTGHPVAQILDAATTLDVDALTIATHGRSGVQRFLLGSVAQRVVRHVPCPVLTVKAFGPSLVAPEPDADAPA